MKERIPSLLVGLLLFAPLEAQSQEYPETYSVNLAGLPFGLYSGKYERAGSSKNSLSIEYTGFRDKGNDTKYDYQGLSVTYKRFILGSTTSGTALGFSGGVVNLKRKSEYFFDKVPEKIEDASSGVIGLSLHQAVRLDSKNRYAIEVGLGGQYIFKQEGNISSIPSKILPYLQFQVGYSIFHK